MMHRRVLALAAVGSTALALSHPARADGFADPPFRDGRVARVAGSSDDFEPPPPPLPEPSTVRLFVGPAGKVDRASALAGVLVAAELGRGPTGLRLSGSWLDVGAERGLSQYTGELFLDFGGRSRFRPVLGAGGGVVRTSGRQRQDGSIDTSEGATIGVGLVRAGIGVRLPFESADARVELDATGTIPAIRGDEAPDLGPWVVAALTVGVGF
jgi:hypothetical protein